MPRKKSAAPTFGASLAAFRTSHGVEVDALAQSIGVSGRSVRRWEDDSIFPRPRWQQRLVDALAALDRPAATALAAQYGLPEPTPAPPVALTLSAVDAATYLLADALSIPAASLRPALARFLLVLEVARVPLADARATLASPPAS